MRRLGVPHSNSAHSNLTTALMHGKITRYVLPFFAAFIFANAFYLTRDFHSGLGAGHGAGTIVPARLESQRQDAALD
jgi:hypothetical protein